MGAGEARREMRQEFDKQTNMDRPNLMEDDIQEDPWEAEIREMEGKNDTCQINGGREDEEDMEQDAISREVRYMWIKDVNDWDLGGITDGNIGSQKQIEK